MGTISRGRDRLVVSIRSYQGARFIDARLYFADPSGKWRPTSKGLTLRPSGVQELTALLELAAKRFEEKPSGARP